MRTPLMLAVSLGLMLPAVAPAMAQSGNAQPTLYEYDGNQYNTLAQCQRAKKRANTNDREV